ncbi:MAG TPA: hypothetical protein VGQ12_07725 [Candidatus Angelobacter sp.]|jgi:hypothetical protein|nr:hypothetical protein [Candidatus Angelobacter sp.]
MKWRDELCQNSEGRAYFMTGMDIFDDELDEAYCGIEVVHTIINAWVSFGAKVGTA